MERCLQRDGRVHHGEPGALLPGDRAPRFAHLELGRRVDGPGRDHFRAKLHRPPGGTGHPQRSGAGNRHDGARVVWEGRDQRPAFGSTFTFTPSTTATSGRRQRSSGRTAAVRSPRTISRPTARSRSGSTTSCPPAPPSIRTAATSWNWVSSDPAPESGSLDFQTIVAADLHELSFVASPSLGMQVYPGDYLFGWVYLDSESPPSEILVDLVRRLLLGAPGLLGGQFHHVWHERDRRPLLRRPSSDQGPMG